MIKKEILETTIDVTTHKLSLGELKMSAKKKATESNGNSGKLAALVRKSRKAP